MLRSVHLAIRAQWRRPAVHLVLLVVVAAAIGAGIAILAVSRSLFSGSLGFSEQAPVYEVSTRRRDETAQSGPISYVQLTALREGAGALVTGAALAEADNLAIVGAGGEATSISTARILPAFFEVFADAMHLGGGMPAEAHERGFGDVVVLSHRLWVSTYGGDSSIIGRTVETSDGPAEVVGVARAGFDLPARTDAWLNARALPGSRAMSYRGFVRFDDALPAAAARERLRAAHLRLAAEDAAFAAYDLTISPLRSSVLGSIRDAALIVAASGLLLVVLAAATAAILIRLDAARLRRESWTMHALGAPHRVACSRAIIQQSNVLVMASVTGLALSKGLVAWMAARVPLPSAALIPGVSLWDVAMAAAAFAVLVGLLGIWPLRHPATTPSAARESDPGVIQATAVGVQALLAVMALSAGLWIASAFQQRMTHYATMQLDGRVVADVVFPAAPASELERQTLELEQRLVTQTGARAVGLATSPPGGLERDLLTDVEFLAAAGSVRTVRARFRRVSPGLFRAIGARISAGRPFNDDDRAGNQRVVLVNESLAAMLPDLEVGRSTAMFQGLSRTQPDGAPVVGVVADLPGAAAEPAAEPAVYVPYRQAPLRQVSFVIDLGSAGEISRVSAVLTTVKMARPPALERYQDRVDRATAPHRFARAAIGLFAAVCLLLLIVGGFAIAAFAAHRRGQELAVRAALGGLPLSLALTVCGRMIVAASVGAAAGAGLMLLLGRVAAAVAPTVLVGGASGVVTGTAIVVTIAGLAGLVPAYRAALRAPLSLKE